jgi:hypothetical protein
MLKNEKKRKKVKKEKIKFAINQKRTIFKY